MIDNMAIPRFYLFISLLFKSAGKWTDRNSVPTYYKTNIPV